MFNFERYLFPFHIPEDYYDLTRESDTRKRVIEEAKALAGSFIPPGIKNPNGKRNLEEIIKIIKEIIISDWPDS